MQPKPYQSQFIVFIFKKVKLIPIPSIYPNNGQDLTYEVDLT